MDTGGSEGTDPGDTTGETQPPATAGEGEAGTFEDPGGSQLIVVPGCGTINVTERIDQGEFSALRDELRCVLDRGDAVPADVLAAAQVADALAAAKIAESDPAVVLDEDVLVVLDDLRDRLPPAFEEIRDEAVAVAEDVLEEQSGG